MCANDLKRPGVQRAHRLSPCYVAFAASPNRWSDPRSEGPGFHNVGLPGVDTGGREALGALRKGPFVRHAVLPADPTWPYNARSLSGHAPAEIAERERKWEPEQVR